MADLSQKGYCDDREKEDVLQTKEAIAAFRRKYPDVPGPDIWMVDCNGPLHPRRFSAACHLRVSLGGGYIWGRRVSFFLTTKQLDTSGFICLSAKENTSRGEQIFLVGRAIAMIEKKETCCKRNVYCKL
nr:hypothetical protein HmN_000354200 [Hymenolepis microstoma]